MNWLQKIAQKYPGSDRSPNSNLFGQDWKGEPVQILDANDKFRSWGIDAPFYDQWHPHNDLASNPNLAQIDPQNVNFAIDHLSEKYYSVLEPVLKSSVDFCRGRGRLYLDYNAEEMPEIDSAVDMLDNDITQTASSLSERAEVRDPKFIQNLSQFIRYQVDEKLESMLYKKVANETFYVRVYGSSQAYGGSEEGGWNYTDTQMVNEVPVQGLTEACKLRQKLEYSHTEEGESQLMDEHRNRMLQAFEKHKRDYSYETPEEQELFRQQLMDESNWPDLESLKRRRFYGDLEAGHGGVRDLYDESSSEATGMGDLDYGDQRDTEGMHFPRGWTPSDFERIYVRVELTSYPKEETSEIPHYE